MASPIKAGKQSVDLAAGAARGSRIRRDPPPAVKTLVKPNAGETENWAAIIGITSFALALFVIALAFSASLGWSPSHYVLRF